MGELFKIHVLNDNSAKIWSNLLVSEVTLVTGLHPGELVLALAAVAVLGVLVLTQLADLVSRVGAVAAGEGVQDPDVILEILLGVHHKGALVARMVVLVFLVFLYVFLLIKYLGTLLTINLMDSLQVILQLSIRFKGFVTVITLEQMIHHVHCQQVLCIELLVALCTGLPVLGQLVGVQFRNAGETFAAILAHVSLHRLGRGRTPGWARGAGDHLLCSGGRGARGTWGAGRPWGASG